MVVQSLTDLWQGFGVALEWHNLMWSFFGVVVGNLIGVLPGMGPLSAISLLLPLTYSMHPVPAILMLAGVFYGSQYGGAIGAILLNLPCHPPHAVTCLDGYPLTRQGKGGTALGITMISSFFAASVGIIVMIFLSPVLVNVAFKFGPSELFSIMLLGLLAGGTMSSGSSVKGVAMTVFGMLIGVAGIDINSGAIRFTFGFPELADGVQLVALALGLFGVAEFLRNVNRMHVVGSTAKVRLRDMRPSRAELKQSFWPMVRGTGIGTLFGAMPGTGPTITTFIAYAVEKRISNSPERFGKGALEGVAAPEASSHSKTQVDFIPTMSLGIPGDPIMALLLGALLIHGIQPGPLLISKHADIFWGLVASFWIGNVLLVLLNVPLIQLWVKVLQVPYRFLYPSALLFIAVGVYSTDNSLFEVGEVLLFGVVGAVLLALEFPVAPILLGYVLGPMIEENFRRTLLLSHGHLSAFILHPISAVFIAASAILIAAQVYFAVLARIRKRKLRELLPEPPNMEQSQSARERELLRGDANQHS
ncbi:tripartite tricarboxylate transporter TctA family protein [Paraburkholderia xenovorans LB400]|uniref:Tripartite tricarboxylate transporter(TTT) family, TctA (12TM) subunit n=1 Tax=Paraburkholderia xenovorans (strain LB400) TaxID=266265 RepID=Q13R12_PARXL|nr:tripartite tricarboxylate transporter permease [Paraburkholderia xenovorans]ABE33477.1 putative tripartite tricarboxylate transporter(TTT) family, TctA (12TM) subunit [Paraburkholderia xenovorans LB400]AIP35220.1 tripartite tricarboxylate transporter TctA family protein [Paraburkholderia xenovorans LB400]